MGFTLGIQVVDTIVLQDNAAGAVALLEGLTVPTRRKEGFPGRGFWGPPVVWSASPWVRDNGISHCTSSATIKLGDKQEERYLNLIQGEVTVPTPKVLFRGVQGRKFSLRFRRDGVDFIFEVPDQLDLTRVPVYVGLLRAALVLGRASIVEIPPPIVYRQPPPFKKSSYFVK